MQYPLQDFKYPIYPELDKTNQYLQPDMPQPMFDKIWENLKLAAIQQLCNLDPSHAEEYKSMIPNSEDYLHPELKKGMLHYFAGCFDPESPLFKQMSRNVCGKLMTYLRFSLEKKLYQNELDKVQLKNPIFITSLPRSGSTYLHNLIVNDPRASGIRLYEHVSPGSKTMCSESRIKMVGAMLGQVQSEGVELNNVHNMDSVLRYEEELFFLEMLGHSFVIAGAMPRLEQYRVSHYHRDYHYAYEACIDEFKMHLMEFPLKDENGFLCTKAVSHFSSMIPMLDVFGKDEYNGRFIWIHREPVDQIKSFIPLLIATKGRFEHDLGKDDMKYISDFAVKISEVLLKNAIATREEWIRQDPSRAKRIYDVSFVDAVTKPKETVQKIYDYFGIEMTQEALDKLDYVIREDDPQKKHGRKKHDPSLFFFNDDDIRKQYMFYYEKFGQYLPNYFGKKQ